MKPHKLLVFDISGEYGHFRKFNTTTSPLTYSFPPRPALAGLLGAILGIERETSPGVFPKGVVPVNEIFGPNQAGFAIQLLNPVKKVRQAFNLLDTKKSFFEIKNRTQIEFELLKNPRFRIFFDHADEALFRALSDRIKAVRHHFTPCLGLSQFTAIVEWVDETIAEYISTEDDYVNIHSVVNLSKLADENPIQFGQAYYSTDTFPLAMNRDRVVTEYGEILIERTGQPIRVKTSGYWKTPFGNILFL